MGKNRKKKRRNRSGRQIRRRVLKILIYTPIIALSVFSIAVFYKFLLHTSYLQLKEITIVADRRVNSQDVMDIAGIRTGENILSLDLKGVRKRIEGLPWVKRVFVRRELPDGLRITVEERVPVALVNFNNALYIIDDQGNLFKEVDYRDKVDLPIIRGLKMEALMDGDSSEKGQLFKALRLIEMINNAHVFPQQGLVSELRVSRTLGFTIYTAKGPEGIILGKDGYQKKIRRLRKLLKVLGEDLDRVAYIDLNYKGKAIIGWRS